MCSILLLCVRYLLACLFISFLKYYFVVVFDQELFIRLCNCSTLPVALTCFALTKQSEDRKMLTFGSHLASSVWGIWTDLSFSIYFVNKKN